MKLLPISEYPDHAKILYDLLAERPAEASISHKAMPTWEEHLEFIGQKPGAWGSGRAHPYQAWYIAQEWLSHDDGMQVVGSVYLTNANEIGVSVFAKYQGHGFGEEAVRMLMELHWPRRFLANVAPGNEPSRRMFEKLGFKLIQQTLALEAE